jgi:apolipoprotein D and lipocalin family protein
MLPMLPNSRLILLLLGLLGATATVLAAERNARTTSVTPIPSLDVPRYMGAWYEIAKFPNRFQRQCAGDTTAHYSLQPDGTVQVINRCRRADGTVIDAVGTARQLGGPTSPTLKVRFAPRWLSFLPFVWGDYWVIDLDPDYQLAAVSEPGRDYLWILARTPTVSRQAYGALLDRLERQGFDVSKLEVTRQAR